MPKTAPREITESFRLERVLKSSRSAIVFRAADPTTGAAVVIKLIPPVSPATLGLGQERFLATMAALASAGGEAFPKLLDHGFTPDGSAFMVAEFVDGERLDALIGAAPARILGLTVEIAAALGVLARAGVAHGNLTLDNVLARRRGGVEHVCLLGLGTAAFHGVSVAAAAPGAAAAEQRADLAALAAACCTLLRAEVSAVGPPRVTLPAVVAQRLQNPALLAAALEQALHAEAAQPLSLDEFRRAVSLALAGGPPNAAPQPPPSPATAESLAPTVVPEAPDPGEDTAPAHVVPVMPVTSPELASLPQPSVPTPPIDDETTKAGPRVELRPTVEPAADRAAGPPAPAPAAASRSGRRRTYLAGGIAAVVMAAVALAVWLARPRPAGPAHVASATPAPHQPTPAPAATPAASAQAHLQRAEAAIALGDLAAAKAELDAIAPEEAAGLAPELQQRFRELRASYLAGRQRAATRAMREAITAGDMAALGRTVRALPRAEETAFPRDRDFLATIADARRALEVQAALLQAERRGAHVDVLQDASVLLGLVPRCAQAAQLREGAAVALEQEAGKLAGGGDYDRALARLGSVRESWPNRPGLAERIAAVTAERAAAQRFAEVMAKVEQSERAGKPEDGLALLAALSPDPRTAARVQEARARLQAQLAKLDAAPPTVTLVENEKLQYKKGTGATITVRIDDDHRVAGAHLFARVEGSGEFVELPLRRGSGDLWSAEISPEFHNNHTVEFYVTASDYSGHVGQLGRRDDPLKLKRKRNWLGF